MNYDSSVTEVRGLTWVLTIKDTVPMDPCQGCVLTNKEVVTGVTELFDY